MSRPLLNTNTNFHDQPLAELDARIARDAGAHGFAVVTVDGTRHVGPHGDRDWAYTTGLSEYHDAPEYLVFGLPPGSANLLLAGLASLTTAGEPAPVDTPIMLSFGDADSGAPVMVRAVPAMIAEPFFLRRCQGGAGARPIAHQVVLADSQGKFPGEPEYRARKDTDLLLWHCVH